jgi:hypothetical protein
VSSSVPNAIPAFISIAQAALPASFTVRFSQVFNPYVAPQSLLITGVTFNVDEFAELGPRYQHEEHYNLECCLVSTAGNDDPMTRLSEVYALYKDITIAVAAKPTLNGTVRLAWCRQLSYEPTTDAKGLGVGQLNFEVQVEARVDSLD